MMVVIHIYARITKTKVDLCPQFYKISAHTHTYTHPVFERTNMRFLFPKRAHNTNFLPNFFRFPFSPHPHTNP